MKLDNRVWYLLSAVIAIAIVVGGFLVGIQPQLAAASASAASLSQVQAQNAALKTKEQSLATAAKEMDSLKSTYAGLQAQIPGDVEGSAFLTELNTLTDSTGVTLKATQFSQQRAYTPAAAAAAAAATTTTGSTASPSPSATPAAAPSVAPGTPLSNPLITSKNLVMIPVSIQVTGTTAQTLAFASALREQPRLMLITSVADSKTVPDNLTSDGYGMTLSGYVFAVATSS